MGSDIMALVGEFKHRDFDVKVMEDRDIVLDDGDGWIIIDIEVLTTIMLKAREMIRNGPNLHEQTEATRETDELLSDTNRGKGKDR